MWPHPFQGRFVIRRLGFAMFNPHIKFEMSTITCNKKMTGNAKCKKSSFWATLWGLRSNAQGSSTARWKARCRLHISDNWTFLASSHGCGTIKRNLSKSAFFDGGGSFVRSLLQPTLDPSAETFMSVQCASPGRGGELVGVCGVCASCVGWRKGWVGVSSLSGISTRAPSRHGLLSG